MGEPVQAVSKVNGPGGADPESIPAEECGQMAELEGTSMSEEEYLKLLQAHPGWENFLTRGSDDKLKVDERILDWVRAEGSGKMSPALEEETDIQ